MESVSLETRLERWVIVQILFKNFFPRLYLDDVLNLGMFSTSLISYQIERKKLLKTKFNVEMQIHERERDFKSGDQPLLGPSFLMCCLTSIWTYLPHNHKLHMYFTYYLTWYESTIDRSFSIAFYSRTLLYMGIIRKCVCDIFSTIGLHPVSKSYIM